MTDCCATKWVVENTHILGKMSVIRGN